MSSPRTTYLHRHPPSHKRGYRSVSIRISIIKIQDFHSGNSWNFSAFGSLSQTTYLLPKYTEFRKSEKLLTSVVVIITFFPLKSEWKGRKEYTWKKWGNGDGRERFWEGWVHWSGIGGLMNTRKLQPSSASKFEPFGFSLLAVYGVVWIILCKISENIYIYRGKNRVDDTCLFGGDLLICNGWCSASPTPSCCCWPQT